VPANRPERFAKALGAGADAVIIDLEDAVPPAHKQAAREGLAGALGDALSSLARPAPVLVRVNAAETPWHADDLAACAPLPLAGVMLAKAETAESVRETGERTGLPVVALVESATGLANARGIARESRRLAFGSIDFAADLGIAHERAPLSHARFELALAARLAGQGAPIDGVTADIRDAELIMDDCRHARSLGFGGKLLIHPAQIPPAREGFRPSQEEISWATRVVDAAGDGTRAIAVDGAMVDLPVVLRARHILERAAG
jgi:citrate lyase subunit beta/citryl-CoA lyase